MKKFLCAWLVALTSLLDARAQDIDVSKVASASEASGASIVAVELPAMTALNQELKPFEYIDVGPKIPNYAAGRGETLNLMQQPVSAIESMQHIVTPEGMHVELFADESMPNGQADNGKMFQGKPIAMNWDHKGRLWICETVDYPNELEDSGVGRDRIRVLEDSDGDGRADKSTVFAEQLSIPTAIAFHRGGLVVQNGAETLYLKDTNGDGKSDVRKVLINNWSVPDTHGGVSNFRNGLDNWIWAMQGYNPSEPVLNPTEANGGQKITSFRMGFFRFKLSQDDDPRVVSLEFLRSTTNNTWGLGISEEGLIFGSTANRQPSFFMPIPNRYYERVKGWAPEPLQMICSTHLFNAITDKIRQVDHHGGYTAAAGHALYTARNYPPAYWNRTAFVCDPSGKLVGTFVIERDGAGMKSESPTNLMASDDEWCAPIMAEVGPDGNMWVLDWYNYIVQHNPTPIGFETGKGKAYVTELRDKKYGRVYRIVPNATRESTQLALANEPTSSLIAALRSPTMLVRLHAQRLLVERGDTSIAAELIKLIDDRSVDAVGLNAGAIHAIHALSGLGLLAGDSPALQAVSSALQHPSAGVRLNAVRALPDSAIGFKSLASATLLADPDPQVVLSVLLKLSDMGQAGIDPAPIAGLLVEVSDSSMIGSDRWLAEAFASAAAMSGEAFIAKVLVSPKELPPQTLVAVARVAEHLSRTRIEAEPFNSMLEALAQSKSNAVDATVLGLGRGWPKDHVLQLAPTQGERLAELFKRSSPDAKGELIRLASNLQNDSLKNSIEPLLIEWRKALNDDNASIQDRIAAAHSLISMAPSNAKSVDEIAKLITPKSPGELSTGLIGAIVKSTSPNIGGYLVQFASRGTPTMRETSLQGLLSRQDLAERLVNALEKGELKISDLSAQQRSSLINYPVIKLARTVEDLVKQQGLAASSDRQKLVLAKASLTERTGNIERGKAVFTKNCASCHVFKGEGNTVGPNLNGMSAHPKIELLKHILDPNSSVEANYRLYQALSSDGTVVSGLLASETLTSIEMVDAQGKRHNILREDIEELQASTKSAMPEGLEQTIDDESLTNLLEYMTQVEKFIPLGLESVANVVTTQGMFTSRDNPRERLVFSQYGLRTIEGVPYQLIDPRGNAVNSTKNAVMLYGPHGKFAPSMPKSVSVRCKVAAKQVYLLGGVAGWPDKQGTSLIVRLQYADGKWEDHPLKSGVHIADYINHQEVSGSKFAIGAEDGGQARTLAIAPQRSAVIDSIEFIKPEHQAAPIILAVTVEQILTHTSHAVPNSSASPIQQTVPRQ